MENLNVTFVAIIIAFFALTSCEKDNMQEMTAETTAQVSERNIPAEGINVVFDEVKTQATAASYKESAQARNRGYKEIGCGFDYDGCTIDQGNSLDIRHYPSQIRALGANFDGQDEYFVWEVPATPNMNAHYDLKLTDMQVDLDLFVFALDRNNRLSAVKGMSINPGAADEKLSLSNLSPGIYIVVVDAYRWDIAGHYNLTLECSATGTGQQVEISYIETTLGTAFYHGNGEWGFIDRGSDMVVLFEETFNDGTNIALKNVAQVGRNKTTTNIYLGLDLENVARSMAYETDGQVAVSDEFGEILRIGYKN